MADRVLTEIELKGATWQKLQRHLQERLEFLRLKNDSELPVEKTARLRGQIAEVKRMLDLPKAAPHIPQDTIPD